MIRTATEEDIPRLCELAIEMHAESRFSKLSIDDGKVAHLFNYLINSDDGILIVAEEDGEIIGGFAGYVVEYYFSHDKLASDFALFVSASHRGGMAAVRLIKEYIRKAKELGAVVVQAGITTGVNVEATTKLYQRLGFVNNGVLFELES